jgi:hypothetical protein
MNLIKISLNNYSSFYKISYRLFINNNFGNKIKILPKKLTNKFSKDRGFVFEMFLIQKCERFYGENFHVNLKSKA